MVTMMLHTGTEEVSRAMLFELPDPIPSSDRHYPLKHCDLTVALEKLLQERGIGITRQHFGLSAAPTFERCYASWDLDMPKAYVPSQEGKSTALVWMQGNAGRGPGLRIGGGIKTTLCDNGMILGDLFLVGAVHVKSLALIPFLEQALDNFIDDREIAIRTMEACQSKQITDVQAESILELAFGVAKALPNTLRGKVHQTYFDKPEGTGVEGDSLWDLAEAGTYALRDLPLNKRMGPTIQWGRLLRQVVKL